MGDARHRGPADIRLALIQGRRVAYETFGDPEGRPVLIIHGAWGGPASTLWNGSRVRWAAPTDGVRLICYDRRNAGLSQYVFERFTLERLASDAVELLDYLNIKQAHVIATSAGGPIGLRLAIDRPERVKSLVMLNTGAALTSMEPSGINPSDPFVADRLATVAKRQALLDLMESEGIAAAVAASEFEWRTPPDPPDPEPAIAAFRANRKQALSTLCKKELHRLARGALLNMQAQRDIDPSGELHRIQCPTLILHGDADTTIPIAYGRALAEGIPNAEFVEMHGVGHGLIVNAAAQRIVHGWLQSVS